MEIILIVSIYTGSTSLRFHALLSRLYFPPTRGDIDCYFIALFEESFVHLANLCHTSAPHQSYLNGNKNVKEDNEYRGWPSEKRWFTVELRVSPLPPPSLLGRSSWTLLAICIASLPVLWARAQLNTRNRWPAMTNLLWLGFSLLIYNFKCL